MLSKESLPTIAEPLASWLSIAPSLIPAAWSAYTLNPKVNVFPSREHVFSAFWFFKPSATKVVILGQDPYHSADEGGTPKAYGVAFGYHPHYAGLVNSSMNNIVDELIDSKAIDGGKFDYSLQAWAKQGVLLLNTRLTVEENKPMSHAGIGWEEPIKDILKYLNDNTDCLFVAWGNEANKCYKQAGIDSSRILATSHPCRYSHKRGKVPFTGSNIFNAINKYLKKKKKRPISW